MFAIWLNDTTYRLSAVAKELSFMMTENQQGPTADAEMLPVAVQQPGALLPIAGMPHINPPQPTHPRRLLPAPPAAPRHGDKHWGSELD